MEIDSDISTGVQTNPLPEKKEKGHLLLIIIIIVIILFIGAIVGGLVIVGLGLQVMNTGAGVPETQVKATWKSAEPFAIMDWGYSNNNMTIILQNNTGEAIVFKEMTLGPEMVYSSTKTLTAGATLTTTINVPACAASSKYNFNKNDIIITYDYKDIQNKTQHALADIVGTC